MKKLIPIVVLMTAVLAVSVVMAGAAANESFNNLALRAGYENNKTSDSDLGEAPIFSIIYTRAINDWRWWGALGYGSEWAMFAKSLVEFELAGGKELYFPDRYFSPRLTFGGGLKILHFTQDEKFIVDYTLISPALVARGEAKCDYTSIIGILDLTVYPLAYFTRGEGYSVSKAAYGDAETGITYGYKIEASLKYEIAQFAIALGLRYMVIESAGLGDFYSGDEFLGPFLEGSWRF